NMFWGNSVRFGRLPADGVMGEEVVTQQSVNELVAVAASTKQEPLGHGVQERLKPPGGGPRACERGPHSVVLEPDRTARGYPEEDAEPQPQRQPEAESESRPETQPKPQRGRGTEEQECRKAGPHGLSGFAADSFVWPPSAFDYPPPPKIHTYDSQQENANYVCTQHGGQRRYQASCNPLHQSSSQANTGCCDYYSRGEPAGLVDQVVYHVGNIPAKSLALFALFDVRNSRYVLVKSPHYLHPMLTPEPRACVSAACDWQPAFGQAIEPELVFVKHFERVSQPA